MKNLKKTFLENSAKFLFFESFKGGEEIVEVVDKGDDPKEIILPTKIPKKKGEIERKTSRERVEADAEIAFLSVDLISGLDEIDPKLNENLKSKITKHLKNSAASNPEELQSELDLLLIGEKTHLIVTGTKKITVPLEINKTWKQTEKNPFPKGNDDIQNKLEQASPNGTTKGFITENGLEYYDTEQNKKVNPNIKLSDILKNDLNPLSKTKITADKLYEIVNNENFSRENAQTIINAMQGQTSSVTDLQTAFSNISKNFAKIVNGVDDKYGENTRRGVRTLAIALSKLVTESTKTIVTYKPKEVKKWHIITTTDGATGESQTYYKINAKKDKFPVINKQQGDNVSYWGTGNTTTITSFYEDGSRKTILRNKKGSTQIDTPEEVLLDGMSPLEKVAYFEKRRKKRLEK